MKRYTVLLQPGAEAEIEAAYFYIREQSVSRAVGWFNHLVDGIGSLGEMPLRCPLAPENDAFEAEIRHLIIPPYRVIFTVLGTSVSVLHVRHTARRELSS